MRICGAREANLDDDFTTCHVQILLPFTCIDGLLKILCNVCFALLSRYESRYSCILSWTLISLILLGDIYTFFKICFQRYDEKPLFFARKFEAVVDQEIINSLDMYLFGNLQQGKWNCIHTMIIILTYGASLTLRPTSSKLSLLVFQSRPLSQLLSLQLQDEFDETYGLWQVIQGNMCGISIWRRKRERM